MASAARTLTLWFLLICAGLFSIAAQAETPPAEDDAGAGFFDNVGNIKQEEILIVQKKFFPKEGRHELTAGILGGNFLDSFMLSLQGGFAYAYHFTQDFGWEAVHLLYSSHIDTSLTEDLRRRGESPEIIRPTVLLSSSFQWSPVYGKYGLLQDYIYHFDFYFILGGGLVISEQSRAPTGVVGCGFRIFTNRWFTVKFEFRDYMYFEKTLGNDGSGNFTVLPQTVFTNNFSVSVGLSIYFPKFQFNPLE